MNDNKLNVTKNKITIIVILIVLTTVLFIADLCVGSSGLTPIQTIKALFRNGEANQNTIIWNIRLPRTLAALIAGFGLSLSGCILQNVLKNDMASPSTLGVTNASMFGANFSIIVLGTGNVVVSQGTSIVINNPYLTTVISFLFALIASISVLLLAKKQNFLPSTVVLIGVAIGFFFQAGTMILQYFAEDTQLNSAISWTFGDLSRASYLEDLLMAVITAIVFILFMILKWRMNGLSSGDEIASSLGIHVSVLRFISLLLSSLICAVCVSFLGIIGFIGLIGPHIAKKLIGYNHAYLIPLSGLCGCSLLLLADIVSRVIIHGVNMPVGAITSLFGAPLFIFILLSKKGSRKYEI